MATFYNVVHVIRQSTPQTINTDGKFDIISALPVEISSSIFRMLDPSSMFASMRVSQRWYRLYRADRPLRRALKQKVLERRRRHMEFIHNFTVKPTDSWYRRDIPVIVRGPSATERTAKKRKRALAKHCVQRAKLLRI